MISTENSSLSWSGKVHRLMKTLSVINRVMVELRKKQAWGAFGSSAKCFYSASLFFLPNPWKRAVTVTSRKRYNQETA